MRRLEWTVMLLLVSGIAGLAQQEHEAIVRRITEALMCTCGCPHIIHQCGDECGVAPQLTEGIAQLVRSGTSEQEIIDMFVAKHGASVLAVPKPEGFNLLAWILPFLALAVGMAVVFLVVHRLKPQQEQPQSATVPEIDADYRRLIDEEMRR